MPRLRQLMRRPTSASTVGTRRPRSGEKRGDTVHEDALRAMLVDDPNDERAFRALAELVRRRAAEGPTTDDPWPPRRTRPRSSAPPTSRSGRSPRSSRAPRGWYPLVELGRLSSTTTRRRPCAASRRPPSATPRGTRSRSPWRCCAPLVCRSRRWASASGTGVPASTRPRSGASSSSPPSRPTGLSTPATTSSRSSSTATPGRRAAARRPRARRRPGRAAPRRDLTRGVGHLRRRRRPVTPRVTGRRLQAVRVRPRRPRCRTCRR